MLELVASPYSYVDVHYRYLALVTYKLIYDEFIPICIYSQYPSFTFPLDQNWLSFRFELNFEKSVSNEKKIITLNLLSMQNRRKTISGQLAPSQGSSQYNLRELILQNFKFNKESPTWRNLGKQIINVLLSEKFTMDIENQYIDNNEIETKENEGEFVFKMKTPTANSLKDLKKKLMKPSDLIHSMDGFKDELFKVINFYLEKSYITREIYNEYCMFANALISEAEKILKEKAQKEEEKLRKMKMKMYGVSNQSMY